MKPVHIALNIGFSLENDFDHQIERLKLAIDKLESAGIKIETVRVPAGSSNTRANREMGPNELKFLEVSGKMRMRCPDGETDREAFAARLLKERFGVDLDAVSTSENVVAPVAAVAEEDDEDLI